MNSILISKPTPSSHISSAHPERLQRSSDYCSSCHDKCIRTVYTTATSFAQRGSEIHSTQDERAYNLQKRVFVARETTFRYLKPKYTKTLKVLDQLTDKMSQLLKFLDMLELQLNLDYAEVVQFILWVYSDCYWSRDVLLESQRILEQEMLKPLGEFKQSLFKYLVKTFPSMDEWTERLKDTIETARDEFGLRSEPLVFNYDTCKAGLELPINNK